MSHRERFAKVYDLPERVLPAEVDTTTPTQTEFRHHLVRSALRAHGLMTIRQIAYLRKGLREGVQQCVADLVEDNQLAALRIADQPDTYFCEPLRSRIYRKWKH